MTQDNHQIMAGGRYAGLLAGRHSKDTFSVGYVWTSVGSHFGESTAPGGGAKLTHEHLVEVNYLANLTPWLLIQPVTEWYVQPGGDASQGMVFVAGFRTKVTF